MRLTGSMWTNAARRVIFSGIQPTGSLHLGNYAGAVRQWLRLQDNPSTSQTQYVAIVDAHALTIEIPNAAQLRRRTRAMAATLLACGIDADKCVLFKQSAIAAHFELAWLCACVTTTTQLQRSKQYKEKAEAYHKKGVPVSLLTYPLLQASDILLYHATHVPVGEDQRQHIELCRFVARTLNSKLETEHFVEPEIMYNEDQSAKRVRSLRDPLKKMSKSDDDQRSCLMITDPADVIVEHCKKALTDHISEVSFDPASRPAVSNLISIHSVILNGKPVDDIVEEARGLTTAQYKMQIADDFETVFGPVREKYEDLMHVDNPAIDRILKNGEEKANEVAAKNMKEIKKLVGFM